MWLNILIFRQTWVIFRLKANNQRNLNKEIVLRYVLDLKKYYLLKNPEEKYDIIPEIWEGHNIADFVDQDIEKVRTRNIHEITAWRMWL